MRCRYNWTMRAEHKLDLDKLDALQRLERGGAARWKSFGELHLRFDRERVVAFGKLEGVKYGPNDPYRGGPVGVGQFLCLLTAPSPREHRRRITEDTTSDDSSEDASGLKMAPAPVCFWEYQSLLGVSDDQSRAPFFARFHGWSDESMWSATHEDRLMVRRHNHTGVCLRLLFPPREIMSPACLSPWVPRCGQGRFSQS
jgi:hypothetical protein